MRRNNEEKLRGEIMTRNYEEKLRGEIMTRNYELVYYVSQNVGIIGILAYPKVVYVLFYCPLDMINIDRQLIPSFWSHKIA